ncbi:type II toxin-antitoxin system ParD family antitoxin [Kovacikia minuta CCNUW1]|uniref:type II toxin-antitoxin system ParD family antitoxin n=1 Tax=Kovacikia minuta TaxID=2931930 RepID=UPI001CC9532F|nr:type II toxin-antitoxin system ParD family antitoxin [Kovacikia minuta]UBF27472.1 type II toxin-antitoxin system ParD family antitoxin [Kovacikia minuta CCNUW1]
MNVSLTPELEQLVHAKVKSGRYLSASEVIREGLRLLEERDRLFEMRLADLQQKVSVGVEQADRDELIDEDDVFAELEADIRQIEMQRG